MLSVEYIKTSSHKANTIDKRAINELKWRILSDIDLYNLTDVYGIKRESVLDECNYIIVEVEGYENIAYADDNNYIYEVVQPINRSENKLYPMQKIEVQPIYKRY